MDKIKVDMSISNEWYPVPNPHGHGPEQIEVSKELWERYVKLYDEFKPVLEELCDGLNEVFIEG